MTIPQPENDVLELEYEPCPHNEEGDVLMTPSSTSPFSSSSDDNLKLSIAFVLMVIFGTANAVFNKLVVSIDS